MSDSLRPHGLYSPWNSPGQNTSVCSLSLLQGIFATQGSNPGLPHCRWILYQLSHKMHLKILINMMRLPSKKMAGTNLIPTHNVWKSSLTLILASTIGHCSSD